jgi:hypothetical protein
MSGSLAGAVQTGLQVGAAIWDMTISSKEKLVHGVLAAYELYFPPCPKCYQTSYFRH